MTYVYYHIGLTAETMNVVLTLLIICFMINNVQLSTSTARDLVEAAAVAVDGFIIPENMNSNMSGNY